MESLDTGKHTVNQTLAGIACFIWCVCVSNLNKEPVMIVRSFDINVSSDICNNEMVLFSQCPGII